MSTRVRGDGVDLAVYERGPGGAPLIVLVHGYPDDHSVWDPVAAILATRFQVVTYDVRGAGRSSVPPSRSGYRLAHLSADLRAVIEATSRGRRAHVVGHDWGSIQSWESVTDPAFAPVLASFTSISGPCLDHVGHWLRQRRRITGQLFRSWYIGAFQVPFLPELAWRGGLARAWPWLLARDEGLSVVPSETLADDAARGVELYRANMLERLRAPRDRHAQVPVQILVPRGDRYVDPEIVRAAERWVPQLSVHEIAGGHWVVRSAPERIAEPIAALVDRVESRPPS